MLLVKINRLFVLSKVLTLPVVVVPPWPVGSGLSIVIEQLHDNWFYVTIQNISLTYEVEGQDKNWPTEQYLTNFFGSYLTICLQKNIHETKLVVRGEPLAGDLVKKRGC